MAELDEIINKEEPSEVEGRIKELSKKVKLTSEERDEFKRLSGEKDETIDTVTKERDFYQGFSDVVSKHPNASEYKDDILAKVKSGYTIEDATVSVLNAQGKLTAPAVERVSPSGGSASTQIPATGQKTVSEMNREERRAALIEAESRGDISLT